MRNALHFFSIMLFSASGGFTQDAAVVAKEAWLGLGVSKPDDVTTTQLPTLPPGIGFVVNNIAVGGPADKAGIRKNDLIWKMDDQMLVNEGQLATLLRLAAPGDVVTVSVFREGKSLDLKITLGEGMDKDIEALQRVLVDSMIQTNDGAMRIVDLEERKALVKDERGTAEVIRLNEGDAVRILGINGNVIFEGLVRGPYGLTSVPESWRRQVAAMRRGLDHALTATPVRQPRPRIVPPQRNASEAE